MLTALLVTNGTDTAVPGETSLRQAVGQANTDAANGTSDTINFDPSLSGAMILLTQGQLELSGAGTGTITIDASSLSNPVTISGNASSRVFLVDAGVQATFTDINIENGAVTNDNGGGIENAGNLTINNGTISGNSASYGGGIENEGALTLSGVTLSGNSATNGGGAIENYLSTLTVSGTGFTDNSASYGGGVDNNGGTAVLDRTGYSGNTATTGADVNDDGGTVTLEGPGWTTSSSIAATNGSTLNLYDNWTNFGAISVDATSTVSIGSPVDVDPTTAGASNDTFANIGTFTIANGATVNLGGVFTADDYLGNFQSLNFTADFSQDNVSLTGTMDNSAADNPVSGGVLALSASTGSLNLSGGEIYQGTITTSGSDELVATSANGTLDGVTLDGTLNVQSGPVTIVGGLTLDSNLEIGGYDVGLEFNDPNPQSVGGTATLFLNGYYDYLTNESTASVTFGSGITILSDVDDVDVDITGPVVNQGAIQQTSSFGQLTISGSGWVNQGSISVQNGSVLALDDNWSNSGSITADAASTLKIGSPVAIDLSSANPADYTWSNTGTISVANGGTVYLGGVFTTDEFENLGNLGISIDLPLHHVYLSGTLENSAADNPVTGGTLALNTSTGSLSLGGGEIAGGTVTTSGGSELVATSLQGTLDGVTLDGTVNFSQDYAAIVILGTLTLETNLNLSGVGAQLLFEDSQPQTVSGTATIEMDGQDTGVVDDSGNSTVTLGPNISVSAGGSFSSDEDAIVGSFDFEGPITVSGANVELALNGPWINDSTISATDGAILDLYGQWTNNGTISVDGTSTIGLGTGGTDAAPGSSTAAAIAWTNTGSITIANGATVYLGSVFTTDEYLDNFAQAGVSVDLVDDTVFLTGTLDNSPADNPVSGGTLALKSATGPLTVSGGEIFEGTVTTTGSNVLAAANSNGTLEDVTLDGTLDMTSGIDGMTVLGDLTLNGTIELGGASGSANYAGLYFQSPSESPQTLGGTGAIQFGNSSGTSQLVIESPGGLTVGPDITIQGGEVSTISGSGPIDFQGTIEENVAGGVLTIEPASWTNEGNISATNGGVLKLYSAWTNSGEISVDATSTIVLGQPIDVDPTSTDPSEYAWTNAGTITIANGATVDLGGWFTTDSFVANFEQGGIAADLALDQVFLTGTIDNSPADNPVSGGVLTLSAATGPLNLSGGEVYEGTVETSGSDDVVATTSGGDLVGVTLDGILDMTQFEGTSATILDGLTLDGTIELGGTSAQGNYGELVVGASYDGIPETIGGTGTIVFGSDPESIIAGETDATVTIGPNVTIEGNSYSTIDSFGPFVNDGSIEENTSSGIIDFDVSSFDNYGSVTVGLGGSFDFSNSDYTQSVGTTTVDGTFSASSVALDGGTLSGTGTVVGSLANDAAVSPGDPTGTLTIAGSYTQDAGGSLDIQLAGATQYGELAVTGSVSLDGSLVVSTLNNFVPSTTDQFTILTFSSVSGDFATTEGLGPFDGGAALVESFTATSLALASSLPNLALTSTTAPPSGNEGDSISLSWTVENESTTTPADALWTDTVYLSAESTLDDTAIPLVTVDEPPTSPLAPGQSYTDDEWVTVPGNLAPGNYYLLFDVVSNGAQAVTNPAADFAAVPITLTAADLTVTAATAPSSSIYVGDTVPVSWTVKNAGNGPADQSWLDAVYLSSTDTLTPSATLLETLASPPAADSPLGAGDNYTQSDNVTIPITAATGTEYLLFVADANGQQAVSGDAAAVLAEPISLLAPQLVADSITAPNAAQFGQKVDVTWQVTNTGPLALDQNWSDQIYFSTSSTFDGSATLLATVPASNVIPLGAGDSYTRDTLVTLPLDVNSTNGTDYLYVVVDGEVQLGISNRAETIVSQSISMTLPPLPDLVPTGLSITGTGFTGQQVFVSWTDGNTGAATATGPWADDVYLATNPQGQGAILAAQVTFPDSIAPGQQSAQLTQPITLPGTPGTYYLMVVADASGLNEGPNAVNNTLVDPTPITVVQVTLPELVVTAITPPSSVVSGTTVPVTYTVTNQGDAPTNSAQWLDAIFISQSPSLTLTGNWFDDSYEILQQPLGVPVFATNPSYLESGQSYTQTVNVPIPVSATGTWYVYVVTDRSFFHSILDNFVETGPVTESNPNNNMTISAPFTVALAPLPDLTVSNVQTPLEAFSGQPLNVSWTVTNNGAGVAIGQPLPSGRAPTSPLTLATPANSTWTDEVFMSPDPTLDSNAVSLGTFDYSGALVPGAGYTDTEQVNLPVGVSGNFYFIVETDIDGQVFESGSTAHKIGATPSAITVNLTPPADLQTTVTSAPTTALASHSLTFTYQVSNIGAGAAQLLGPDDVWTDSFYLSPTSTFQSSTAILIGSQVYGGSLNAGTNYQNTVTETLPNAISGDYYLIVVADSGNAVFELDETSKVGASSTPLQIASKPADLVVSAASAPSIGQAGGAVLVNWTVTNQGTGDTAVTTWQDNVYADTSSTLTSDAVLLGSFTHDGLLGADDSYSQSQVVTLPITLSGDYYLYVVTNEPALAPNEPTPPPPVYESNFNNDTSAALPIDVTEELANLQVTSATMPSPVQAGSSVTVDWTVANNGAATTNSSYWYDDVWMSTNPTLGSGGTDVFLGTVQHNDAEAPGDSYSASLNVTVPGSIAPGTWYFIVAPDRPVTPPNDNPDTDNLVYEANSAGNEYASQTTVTPGANLVVSNVTAPVSVDAGQSLTVGWTVTNNGAGGTGNVPIDDAVYLSYDQVLSNSSIYLGTVEHSGNVGAGDNYTQTATLQLPSGLEGTFYVFVQSNTNQSVYEQTPANAIAYDATSLQVLPTPPADLVAGTVTIPVDAVPGQNITITYQVTNNGTNPANGAWTDVLYLSSSQTWSPSDPILGTVAQDQDLAPGDSYTGTLTAPLPGVTPGQYYVILRTNILDTIPETTLANNLSASLTQTSIAVPALTLGTPTTGTLGGSQSAFYEVTVGAGQTLEISFDSQTAASLNELYVSFNGMPTRGSAEYSFSALADDQVITIPATQAGTYYILAYGNDVPSPPESYSITAAIVPFAVQAVAPGTVGTGSDTIEIDGSKFDNNTTFQLLGPSNTVVDDTAVYLQDSTTAFVTFDLTGMPTGTYTVQATAGNASTTQLVGGLTVVPATAANVQITLSYPSSVLPGSQGDVTVSFTNESNTDALAPLLEISATNALLELPDQDAFSSNPLWFLGISANGPAGTLRPGESGQIAIPYEATGSVGQRIAFNLQQSDDSQPIDWASQQSSLQLPTIPNAAWPAVFANFVANVGSTVLSYHTALANAATYVSEMGEPVDDVLTLLSFEIGNADDQTSPVAPVSITDDNLPAPGMSLTFTQTNQQSISGRDTLGILGYGWTTNWDISASTLSNGDVTIANNGGTLFYALEPDGSYQDLPIDHSVLTLVNGAYTLTLTDGTFYRFNPNGTLAYVQDPNGNRISLSYDAAGQLVTLTDSNGESMSVAYNSFGRLSVLSDSNGQTETFAYDSTGQYLTSVTDSLGTTTFSYVNTGTPQQDNALAEVTDGIGTEQFFSYDSEGRLIDLHENGGAQDTTFAYLSPAGYTETSADGSTVTILTNLEGAIGESVDALGNATLYKYDSAMDLVEVDGPNGTRSTFSYDSNGNLLSATDPLGNTTTFTYDVNNNVTSYTDAGGNTTTYQYSAQDNLLAITQPDGAEQQFTYNPLGEATQLLNADGDVIGDAYNSLGEVTRETFSNGTNYAYTYDAFGNLTTATDAQGNVTTFVYGDSSNPEFLTEVEYPNGTYLKFSYNAVGLRTQSVDQTDFTINYSYNSLGGLTELTDGNGDLIVKYTYDAAGLLTRKDMGNGTYSLYTYDANGRVLSITNYAPNNSVNSFDDYTYDALGNNLTDTNRDGEWAYTYDADGQLIGAVFTPNSSDPDGLVPQNLQYVYDANGDLISETINGVKTVYDVNDENEYTSSTTNGAVTSYSYDADGNLISQSTGGSTTSYTYDELNELTGVNGAGNSASYTYDPLGNLISQTVDGVTTNNQVDPSGDGDIVAQYSATGQLLAHYVFGDGLTSQVSAGGSAAYYDFNALGSTIGITNSAGVYVNAYAYDPYGATIAIQSTLNNPFTFVGLAGVATQGTNLFNMRNRVYDSQTGQFLSQDPIGLAGGPNNREYAGNSPVNYDDPLGLCKTVTIYIWTQGVGHASIWVDGHYVSKFQKGATAFNLGPPWASNSFPPVYGTENGAGSQFAYTYTVPDNVGQGMINQMSSLNSKSNPPAPWNVYYANCAEDVTSVLRAGGYWVPGFVWTPTFLYWYLQTFNLQTNCPPPTPPKVPTSPGGGSPQPGTPGPIILSPSDPNNIIGPAGFGDGNYVAADELLPYQIDFENDPTAGLPAQQVTITQELDASLDWQSFRLGSFGFGGQVFNVPANAAFYQTTIEETGYEVQVAATINEATGVATWVFTTIDPSTGQIPLDPSIGFLPPDDPAGTGEGFVTYTILANSSAPTGTVINAQATVDFYTQAPINTPQISNTLDTGTALSSSVNPLPAQENTTQFNVSWSGTDAANSSGIASFTIYVSTNGGPYTAWLSDTTLTSAPFVGVAGDTYAFYSIATDNVGDVELPPALPQAVTQIVLTTSEPPSITAPTNVGVDENSSFTFSGVSAIGVSDPSGTAEQLTLSVSDGTLGLTSTNGLTFIDGTTNDSSTITVTGQISAINSDLGGLTYTPTSGYSGPDSLQISDEDTSDSLTGSLSVSITVQSPTELTPTVVATDAGGAFDGGPFAASATATGSGGVTVNGTFAFTYYVGSTATGQGTSTAPTVAGTYTVVAAFTSSNPDYSNADSNPLTFAISQATPVVAVTDAGGVFNGSPFPATATIAGVVSGVDNTPGGSLEGVPLVLTYYVGTNTTGTPLPGAPSTAGSYTVVASFAGSQDYESLGKQYSFVIFKATPVVTVTDAGGFFDGSPFPGTATIAGVVAGVDNTPGSSLEGVPLDLIYYLGTNTTGTPLPGAPSTAGSYTVVASFAGSQDYSPLGKQYSFVIFQAEPVVTLSDAGGVYDGSPYAATATIAGVVAGVDNTPGSSLETVPLVVTYYAGTNTTGTPLSGAPSDPGSYTVVASFAGSQDYDVISKQYSFVISQASPSVAASDAGGTYDGDAFPASGTATGVGGATISGTFAFTYYVGSSPSGQGSSTAPLDAGTYTVVAAFTSGNSDYGNATSGPVTFTISPATPTVLALDAGGTYNGQPFPATGMAVGAGGSLVSGNVQFTYYPGTVTTTPSYSQIIAFGDSLSDTGNDYILSGDTSPQSPPYYDGRFSNGPNWIDQLSVLLGVADPQPSLEGGTDYAYGGATAESNNQNVPPLAAQIEQYLQKSSQADPNALYTVLAGANDFFDGETNAGLVANAVEAGLTSLIDAGAKHILVSNLPPQGDTPLILAEGPSAVAAIDALDAEFNADLAADVQALRAANPGVTIDLLDLSSMTNAVEANAAAFGFTDTTDEGINAPANANLSRYLFWDNVHPTTAADSLIADAAYSAVATAVGSGNGSSTPPTNAGTYTVIATFTSSDPDYSNAESAPVTFTIGQGTPTVTVSDADGTYDGDAFAASGSATGVSGSMVSGTFAYTYYVGSSASGQGSSTAPVDAGTYTVVAAFTSTNSNYVAGPTDSSPVTFTIDQATPTVVATDAGGLDNGNSYPASATATGVGGATVSGTFAFTYFAGTSASGNGTSTAPSSSGTYTVVAAFTSADLDYVTGPTDSVPVTFTIGQSTPTVTVSDAGGTYDGDSFPASATATGIGGVTVSGSSTFTYYVGSTDSGNGTSTAPTNAGTYTVVAAFTSSDPNYVTGPTDSAPDTFTIGQATPTVAVSDAGGMYNGNPFPASATATGVGGAAVSGSFAYSYYVGSSATGTPTTTAPTNAGTYTVVAAFTSSNSNYVTGPTDSAPVKFTIGQATPTVVVTDAGGTYNGNPFPASATATGVGGATVSGTFAYTYYVGTSASGTGTSTAPTNVGTYTVVAAFTSTNANYVTGPTDSAPVKFTISAATGPIITAPSTTSVNENSSLVFSAANGDAISVTDSKAGNGTEQLTLTATHGTITLASAKGVTATGPGAGASSGSPSITIKGTLASINAALNGLKFTPTTSYFGSASLAISYKDLGDSQTASATVAITVVVPASQPTVTIKTLFPTPVSGEPVPLVIEVSDTNAAAQATAFTFTISFGDGHSATLSSKSPVIVNHVYTTTGTFTVGVTATDEFGHTSAAATTTVKVVPVAVETDPFNSSQTALFVGTSGTETIDFTASGRSGIAVTVGGVNEGVFTTSGPLLVFGQGGKDTVKEAAGLKNSLYLLESPTAKNVEADMDEESIFWAGLTAAVEILNA